MNPSEGALQPTPPVEGATPTPEAPPVLPGAEATPIPESPQLSTEVPQVEAAPDNSPDVSGRVNRVGWGQSGIARPDSDRPRTGGWQGSSQ